MSFAKITSEGQSWEVIRLWENASCLTRGWLKKRSPNRHFRGISFKIVLISTNCCILNRDYCDKLVNHCPYIFSSIWPSCFRNVKQMGDSCNGVDRLVQWCRSLRNVRWTATESQSRLLAFLCKFRHFTLHTLTGRSSKSLIVYKKKTNKLRAKISIHISTSEKKLNSYMHHLSNPHQAELLEKKVWFWFRFYGPLTHFRSFRARSVTLTTMFLGKPPRQFTSI